MAKIKDIRASEILDSRGNPTIETSVVLSDGSMGIASVPSGQSIGTYEASELRDRDPARYNGMGVLQAIQNIHETIAPQLSGMEAQKQQDIDRALIELDGTQNKGKLGANAMLSVSIAICKAAAKSAVLPPYLYVRQFINTENTILRIPTPLFSIIDGGKYALNNLSFLEYMVIPATAKPYEDALQMGVTVYNALRKILQDNNMITLVGDEGGFGANITGNEQALEFLKQAIDASSLRLGYDIFLGIDAAASLFHERSEYHIKEKSMALSSSDLAAYYQELNNKHHLLYLEDPMAEEDWDGWTALTSKLSQDTIVAGDDLTVTNPYRLQMALDKKVISGIVIKPNQIGTVLETIAVVEVARQAGLKIIISERSGETNDDFIADFAVGVSADYVKFGAPARGERIAKYDRLLHINKQMQEYSNITK